VVKVTSASGAVADSLAFDAWGLRRSATNWAALGSPFGGTQQTERGYTGHEHLDNVGLIHVNGRVQDPRIGRFLSPDPTVQDPFNTQSHDRYSYAWNNPATLVDPSGFQTDEPNHTVGPCLEGMSGEDCLTLISMDPSRTSMNYASDSHVLSSSRFISGPGGPWLGGPAGLDDSEGFFGHEERRPMVGIDDGPLMPVGASMSRYISGVTRSGSGFFESWQFGPRVAGQRQ
jgi:RHS repeat-associated protein